MRTTTYCYPWDLARLGVEETLDRISGEGFDAIDLAGTYHPIDSISPREGFHYFHSARGGVFFPASGQGYGRIKPAVHADRSVTAAWPRAADYSAKVGLDLNSWTITLFQPWIRDAYPDTARVRLGGELNGSGVCAANEDVRAYLAALCADISGQFGTAVLRLEAVLPYAADFDWMRPRVMVAIPPFAKALSSMCFCGSCQARGKTAGLDVEAIRAKALTYISSAIEAGSDITDQKAAIAADAEVTAFAELHVRASIELIRLVDTSVGGKSVLATNVGNPYRELLGEARNAALYREFLDAVGQVDLSPADPAENLLTATLNAELPTPHLLSTLCTVSRLPEPTVVTPAQRVAARGGKLPGLQDEVDRGTREFSLYNYGLITEAEVSIFRDAIAALKC